MGDSPAIPAASNIVYEDYHDETQLREISVLVAGELSEPYSIFTYRYFLVQWPKLCICVYDTAAEGRPLIGAIICKVEKEPDDVSRGYIGMLVVDKTYRGCGMGSTLVRSGIKRMMEAGSEEIYLETEVCSVVIDACGIC
jgi:peptide alpha-N-acetyltransferase